MSETILSMRGIVKQYRMGDEIQTVLRGIDLDVKQGEFVAVLGPSGSGKSTLMNIIGAQPGDRVCLSVLPASAAAGRPAECGASPDL